MAQINTKITIRSVYFGILTLTAVVMISAVRLTVASELVDSFKADAEQGFDKAQLHLGYMYAAGEGVPEDDAEAVQWYRMAAEQGFDKAQLHLGYMYAAGEGIPKDYIQAYAWWNIAAAQGEETAKENLESITNEMSTAGITKAQELSREYWEAYGPNRASSE